MSAVLVGAAMASACCDPDFVVESGVTEFSGGPHIGVPATAARGVPFTVTVETAGGCIDVDSTEVSYINADFALVEPLDRRKTHCIIKKLCFAHHEAEVTVGTKTVIFRGRNSDAEEAQLVDHQATVLVE